MRTAAPTARSTNKGHLGTVPLMGLAHDVKGQYLAEQLRVRRRLDTMSIAGVPQVELATSEAVYTRLITQMAAERGQYQGTPADLDAVPNNPEARAKLVHRTQRNR